MSLIPVRFDLWRCPLIVACALAMASALAGCVRQQSSRFLGEPTPAGSRSVFVIGRAYHSGFAVRTRDLPPHALPLPADLESADYLEFGWGARDYYPIDNPGLLRGARVMLTPSASTIEVNARRRPLTQSLRDYEVVELRVSDDGFSKMLEYLRSSYTLDRDGRGVPVPADPLQEGRFFESPLTFDALQNCNVWTARALRSAGIPVDPAAALSAGMLFRQVREVSDLRMNTDARSPLPQ